MRPTIPAQEWKRYPVAVAAGFVWAAAFPNWGVAGLAWIAPALLLGVGIGLPGAGRFRVGYIAGLAHYLTSLYWLLLIPVPFYPILGWLALAMYLALYPALWVGLCWWVYPNGMALGSWQDGKVWDRFLTTRWGARCGWTLFCAALWAGSEFFLGRFLSGFPWNFLGASQYRMVPFIQVASITGVFGISFLLVWFSCALLGTMAKLARQPDVRRMWFSEVALPLLSSAVLAGWGFHRVMMPESTSRTVSIALVQPSIPQALIWDGREDAKRFQQLLELSEKAAAEHPKIILWPEAGAPGYARWDTNIFPAITQFARDHSVWLIFGSDDAARRQTPGALAKNDDTIDYFNAAFLINPRGELVAGYRKRKLVIFGEYIPLIHQLPFLKWLTPIQGGFTPGAGAANFDFSDLHIRASPLICFEDNFPEFVRSGLDDDTDLLINLTNNGWFGESAAQWQHAANAVFRTLESGLPLVRCSNNGLTCWMDARGRLREFLSSNRPENIYGPGFKIVNVPLPTGTRPRPTFYRKHGDWFAWTCLTLGAIGLARRRFARKSRLPNGDGSVLDLHHG